VRGEAWGFRLLCAGGWWEKRLRDIV